MKALKFTFLLLSILIMCSCAKKEDGVETENKNAEKPELEDKYICEEDVAALLHAYIPFVEDLSCLHELLLSFQDSSGNDLTKGIELFRISSGYMLPEHIKWELCKTEYVFFGSTGLFFQNAGTVPLVKGRSLSNIFPKVDGNYDYLYIPSPKANFVEKFMVRLTCPYIFGNDSVQEIITWWKQTDRLGAYCYRIEYGDKEITDITYIYNDYSIITDDLGIKLVKIKNFDRTYSIATIVLDR